MSQPTMKPKNSEHTPPVPVKRARCFSIHGCCPLDEMSRSGVGVLHPVVML